MTIDELQDVVGEDILVHTNFGLSKKDYVTHCCSTARNKEVSATIYYCSEGHYYFDLCSNCLEGVGKEDVDKIISYLILS